MKLTVQQVAELLAWVASQDRLRIERWHHPGGRTSVSVWTALDDDDEPIARADDSLQALIEAKRKDEARR